MHLNFFHVFSWLDSLFLFSTEIIFRCLDVHSWVIHSPTEGDILVASKFWKLEWAAIIIQVKIFVWILGSKISADGDCSCEIKRRLLLGRKAMTNLDSILKSSDITLLTEVRLVKVMVFPVVMYGCESWTIKKAEHRRFNAFKLWCWRRLLRVLWTARRSNQPIPKEICLEDSMEGVMLKVDLQHFGHLMWRTDSVEKTLMLGRLRAGGEGDDRGWDGSVLSPSQWILVWAKFGEIVKGREAWHAAVHGVERDGCDWVTELN